MSNAIDRAINEALRVVDSNTDGKLAIDRRALKLALGRPWFDLPHVRAAAWQVVELHDADACPTEPERVARLLAHLAEQSAAQWSVMFDTARRHGEEVAAAQATPPGHADFANGGGSWR